MARAAAHCCLGAPAEAGDPEIDNRCHVRCAVPAGLPGDIL